MNEVYLKYPTVLESGKNLVDYVAEFARVSNPSGEHKSSSEGLCNYLLKHKHWSPFEMVNVVLEVETSRDIARQLLRHRSFSFQEFSQRYSATETVSTERETRLQDTTNRQNSLPCNDPELDQWFKEQQKEITDHAFRVYDAALKRGVAKEQARVVLPEGLTYSRLFVNGSLRSWIHYVELRTGPETQKEHRNLAYKCSEAIAPVFPMIRNFTNLKD